MPKAIGHEERELTKQALRRAGLALIKSKGLRHVTVDDITKAAGIAKGSFYAHYRSKEELLYEVFCRSERKIMDALMNFPLSGEDFKGEIEKRLHEIYLAPDSLVLYIRPEDVEYIRRKFPAEAEDERCQKNFTRAMDFFGFSETDMGTLAYLMDALQHIVREPEHGKASQKQSLDIIVRAIADFINEKATKGDMK